MTHDGNSHFLMALGQIDGGRVIEEADGRLKDVIEAVQRTGKAGSVQIKLNLKPNGELGLEASADLKATAPQVNFGRSFFYTDRTGSLTRNAPDAASGDLLRPYQDQKGE